MSASYPPVPQDIIDSGIFVQPLSPIRDSLVGSFFVGVIPLLVVLVLLGVFRLPAYVASLISLVTCIFIAIFGWHMPAQQAFESIGNGIVYANWPIMWIVVNAMFVYNIAVRTGAFDLFRRWMITNTPPDQRVMMIIISFSFGALLEGVAGFGTPGAICSALLVSLGFDKVKALTYTLIFDTTPVAFGALGIPVTTLAGLTGLPVMSLSSMMGRQLPFVSVFLPAYALIFFAGFRKGLLECWPLAVVGGVSFAGAQALFANLVGPQLPDLMGGLISLLALIILVQFWKPPYADEFKCDFDANRRTANKDEEHVAPELVDEHDITESTTDEKKTPNSEPQAVVMREAQLDEDILNMKKPTLLETAVGWSPWVLIVVVVIIWSFVKVNTKGAQQVHWPHLDNQVWLTLYGRKYAAVWTFEPLATGTAILVSNIPFSIIMALRGASWRTWPLALRDTFFQLWIPVLTVSFILAVAYLYNYSGMVYTIGLTISHVGRAFPFLSAWLGWLACFLSGSDTSANSLFGNLQVVAAREIGLSAVLMAATNSNGAVTAKMISPQSLATGVSTIGMQGREGFIFRRTVLHSIFFVCIMGAITCIQEYGTPGIIPSGDETLT